MLLGLINLASNVIKQNEKKKIKQPLLQKKKSILFIVLHNQLFLGLGYRLEVPGHEVKKTNSDKNCLHPLNINLDTLLLHGACTIVGQRKCGLNKCSDRSIEVKLPSLLGNMTDRPTN